MTRRHWTAAELATLRARYPHEVTAAIATDLGRPVKSLHQQAKALGLRKGPAFRAWEAAENRARALVNPRIQAGFFRAGHAPANKGIKGWQAGGRSRETQFKRGSVSPRWDPEIYCVGALRITSDGELQIKVVDGPRGWVQMSHYVWAMHNGGRRPRRTQVLRHRNGDPHDCAIENLELVSREENMRRNSLHKLPKPLAYAIQLRTALNRRLARQERTAA